MAERLPEGRLLPAAKPVSTFITPAQIEAQKPASPMRLQASNGGIGLQATAAKPNVAGSNPGEQLGQALSKFSTTLGQTLNYGLELYASHEYQAGQNEVMKAQLLAERQVDASSVEYAQANQALARKDPYAALAMDQTNPFRNSGRQLALSQIASGEIGSAMEQEYRKNAGALALKDPADPAINQVKADAINQITEKYGLDPTKAGFTKFFLPAMNRSWEKVTAQHVEDRNNYLKDTVWRGAGVGVAQILRSAREKGQDLGQAAILAGQLLDQEAIRLGLPGEATDMKQKALTLARQSLLNAGETDAARAIEGIPVGPADDSGYRMTARQMFQLDIMEDDDKYGEIRRRNADRELEPIRQALTDEVGVIGLQMEDGPGKLQALQDLMRDPRFQALPLGERLEIIGNANKLGEEIQGQGFSEDAAGNFVAELDQQFGFGSQRDLAAAEARLNEVLAVTKPEDRPAIRRQFAEWKNRQQKQPWDLINPAINNKIKANLAQHYPDLGTSALRGATNIEGILQWGDATSKESAARQLAAYRTHVLTRLDEARTAKGAELSDSEALGVINKALAEYGSKDPDAKAYLFPKVPGGAGTQPAAAPPKPPGQKPSPVQGLNNPTVLDNAPDRATRLKDWQNQPLLTMDATSSLALSVLNGGSFPAAFRRAAKDAGTTPEQLLLKQIDFYPNGLKLNPQQRNQILKQGNQARAAESTRQSQGNIDVAALVRDAGGWMMNTVLGVTPAMARTSEMDLLRRYGGYGGGGGQWDSGPAVAASHADSGSGYTIPGARDASGRPPVFSRGGANSFAAMVRDSGGQVKASDIASSQRSEAKNRAVGGANGSHHLAGNAMDIHGTSEAWIRKHGAKYGWYVNDYDGSHGGHFEFRGGGSARPMVATRPGGGMTGLATYYTGSGGSDGVAGGPTANGERYDPNKMTAAVQWSLRGKYLNKWVTVEDMDTGKTVKVWVNDIGQMGGSRLDINRSDPRVIDLSPAAFKKLFGSTQRGVGRIRIVSAS